MERCSVTYVLCCYFFFQLTLFSSFFFFFLLNPALLCSRGSRKTYNSLLTHSVVYLYILCRKEKRLKASRALFFFSTHIVSPSFSILHHRERKEKKNSNDGEKTTVPGLTQTTTTTTTTAQNKTKQEEKKKKRECLTKNSDLTSARERG